jgi:mannose-6-phosphate isomerase-like protein (cupin superfamily)
MNHQATLAEMLARLPGPQGERYATAFTHGTLRVVIYAPRGSDPQEPHEQDEVYLVVRGHGTFLNGAERHPFQEGDVLFVPARVEHRFEELSDDLVVWALFYGPPGGEGK